MTKVILNSLIGKSSPKVEVEAGSYWMDISDYGNTLVFIVTEVFIDESNKRYALVNLIDGSHYGVYAVKDINDVFGNDREDFILLDQVTISYK